MDNKTKIIIFVSVLVVIGLVIAFSFTRSKDNFDTELSIRRFVSMLKPKLLDNKYALGTVLQQDIPKKLRDAMNRFTVKGVYDPKIKVPDTFDARQKWGDRISLPLDQAQCGSCWAFATCGALQDRLCILLSDREFSSWPMVEYKYSNGNVKNIKNFLSPYMLDNCQICNYGCDPQSNKNCNTNLLRLVKFVNNNNLCSSVEDEECAGGFIQSAMIFANQIGLITSKCRQKEFRQTYSCELHPTLKDSNRGRQLQDVCRIWKFNKPTSIDTVEHMQQEIFLRGSIVVGFMVYPNFGKFFESNPKGVYSDLEGLVTPEGGHAVCIVGWGEQDGKKYWLCRNSWGLEFGDNGYFRILRGENFCTIEQQTFICEPDLNASFAKEFDTPK